MAAKEFYLRFENKFRGSKELIRQKQTPYLSMIQPLKVLHDPATAVDLGSGRGEWLELLCENGWIAVGVDRDAAMRESCSAAGFSVVASDALRYVSELPSDSTSLITGFHIAEHLPFEDLFNLVRQVHRALRPGGMLILETPNPENLIVGACTFYCDPTHRKPLPPDLLRFLVEDAGFDRARILRLNPTQGPDRDRAPDIPSLADVFYKTSWDVSVICQKSADPSVLELFGVFEAGTDESTISFASGVEKFDQNMNRLADALREELRLAVDSLRNTSELRMNRLEAIQNSLDNELKAANARLASVYASRSWQLTAPLRWCDNLWRRLATSFSSKGITDRETGAKK